MDSEGNYPVQSVDVVHNSLQDQQQNEQNAENEQNEENEMMKQGQKSQKIKEAEKRFEQSYDQSKDSNDQNESPNNQNESPNYQNEDSNDRIEPSYQMKTIEKNDDEINSSISETEQAIHDDPNVTINEAAAEEAFGSDDSLSDLDEEQFRDFDEAQLEAEPEYTVVTLPSFHKKQHGEAERVEQPSKAEKGLSDRKRRKLARKSAEPDTLIKGDEEEEGKKRPSDPILAAKWDLDEKMNAAISSQKRRSRIDEDDLEAMADDEIMKLREKMRLAAIEDAEANEKKQPASRKLAMLPVVESILRKKSLYDSILDNNLLDSVRMWLEPLPDKSLPALDVQKALFDALQRLPIQTDHLRESSIGKVVLFYKKSNKPDATIKRIAERLIAAWTRPIIKRSANFNDRAIRTAVYDPMQPRPLRLQPDTSAEAKRRVHAQIPRQDLGTFEIAPRSQLQFSSSRTDGGSLRESEQVRKMKARMKASRAAAAVRSRKSNLAI